MCSGKVVMTNSSPMKNYNTTSLNKTILKELEREFGVAKGTLKNSDRLEQFKGWDSLCVVMFLTALDKEFNILIDPIEIAEAETIQDLINIANSKLKSQCNTQE